MQLTPVSLLGESHGQRSLAGYSPWGCKESDTTDRARAHTHTHTHKLSVNKCVSFWCFILHLNDILKALGIWQLSKSSRFPNQGKLTRPKISSSQIFEVQHTSGW